MAPTVTQLSAKLKTGSKKVKGFPPIQGSHCGQVVSMMGK